VIKAIIVCLKCLMGTGALVGFSDCFGQKA